MRIHVPHRLVLCAILATSLVLTGACKSELDGKPAAKVEEPAKADEAKKDAPKADEAKKDAPKADEAKKEAPKAAAPAGESLNCDVAASSIGFVGAKITGDHKGSFKQFSGKATVSGGKAVSAEFTVQTASVEADAEKLTGHLKSPDFFDVAKFPTATFKSSEIKEGGEGGTHTVTGNLTLHGVTKKISFPATIKAEGGSATAKAEFKINRKDFGIVYPGKPDDLIKDDVLLKLDLNFAP